MQRHVHKITGTLNEPITQTSAIGTYMHTNNSSPKEYVSCIVYPLMTQLSYFGWFNNSFPLHTHTRAETLPSTLVKIENTYIDIYIPQLQRRLANRAFGYILFIVYSLFSMAVTKNKSMCRLFEHL